jgi:hypothetical protein
LRAVVAEASEIAVSFLANVWEQHPVEQGHVRNRDAFFNATVVEDDDVPPFLDLSC